MERNITVTLEKAKEWYNSGDATLQEIALQAFSREEFTVPDFTKIKTFEDALNVLGYTDIITKMRIESVISAISIYSKASAAMFKLNIIKKALNLGQDLHLTKSPKGSYFYYPYNPFVAKSSTWYESKFTSDKIEAIGKIKSRGEEYNVFGGNTASGCGNNFGFLSCANEKIAEHFSKYFGMLITEAKYGDMVDFEIVEEKYKI